MKNVCYKYKFGIILEAYCRGIGDQLQSLVKQIDVIDNLSAISNFVKQNKEKGGVWWKHDWGINQMETIK